MRQIQIEALRDFAIDHLPRAQADRAQHSRLGGSEADFYRKLAVTSVMVQAKPETPAIQLAAARMLSTVSLLCSEREEPLTTTKRTDLLCRLTSEANELCGLTGKELPWLASAPTTPAPADAKRDEVLVQATTDSIAGKFLTTEQTAEVLGVMPATLRAWAREQRGPIQPIKVGRHYRYKGNEVLALLESDQMPTPRRQK